MADYCNVRSSNGGSSGGLGTFSPSAMGSYHHHTLQRTATAAGSGGSAGLAGSGGAGAGSALSAMDVKERLGTIDGSQRVRIVRLTRPQNFGHHFNSGNSGSSSSSSGGGSNFGFSIRGGLEYGTGFFISAIEKDSEADRQGLRVGDQIVRVNGYQVDDAVHRELAQFVANQERLVLKVRSVGILPVKERASDPLTWHVVSFANSSNSACSSSKSAATKLQQQQQQQHQQHRDERTSCSSSSTSSSSTLEELPGRDLKIILSVAPRTKLGCGICKGPDWKPGIFVQFTKEGGVAREAGLRPGDQILSCNGREFADITFAEAVSIMKASHVLELVIRPGAGIDMFPGESSGYNSSASSVNGDQSPCWGDSAAKRLSIVREESISNDRRGKEREKLGPKTSINRRNNTTIIEFSENGTVVNNSIISDKKKLDNEEKSKEGKKLADICFVSKQSETKTIIVEVHRSASTNSIHAGGSTGSAGTAVSSGSNSHIPPPPPLFADKIPPPPPLGGGGGGGGGGLGSGYSTTNSARSGQHKQQRSPSAVSLADSSASSGIDCGGGPAQGGIGGGLGNAISEELKRRAEKKGTSTALEPAAALTELENRLKEKRFRPPTGGGDAARHSALMDEFKAVHKRMFKNGFDNAELKKSPSKEKLQPENSNLSRVATNGPSSTISTTSSNSSSSSSSTISGKPSSQSKGTMGRVAATEMAKANGDVAELESIESFKLTNPTPTPIRPPSYYFCPQNSGPPTMKKSQKPIAITISEYSSNAQRDQAKKAMRFDFADVKAAANSGAGRSAGSAAPMGNIKHELEKTLSLSNLRQRSESRENLVERIHIVGRNESCAQEQAKLSRSSSVANVARNGTSATTVSNGNRITIAISNSNDKKK